VTATCYTNLKLSRRKQIIKARRPGKDYKLPDFVQWIKGLKELQQIRFDITLHHQKLTSQRQTRCFYKVYVTQYIYDRVKKNVQPKFGNCNQSSNDCSKILFSRIVNVLILKKWMDTRWNNPQNYMATFIPNIFSVINLQNQFLIKR